MQQSHGEKIVLLDAGATKPVQAPGDFVFVRDCAFPIRVIINGEAVTMEAGEKRRLSRDLRSPDLPAFSEFEVENKGGYAQRVTLIVGTGDYEKIIVSGDLNVSAYVKTATRGEAASLPAEIAREVGATIGTTNFVYGTAEYTSANIGNAAVGECGFYHRGKFYVFGSTSNMVYQVAVDTADGVFDNSYAVTGGNMGQALGAALAPDGTVYYRNSDALYSMKLGVWAGAAVASCYDGFSGGNRYGLAYAFGRLYSIKTNGSAIESVALDGSGKRSEIALGFTGTKLLSDGNRLYIYGAASPTLTAFVIAADGTVTRDASADIANGTVDTGAIFAASPGLLYAVSRPGNGTFTVEQLRTVTTYGSLWVQPVGDASKRIDIPQFAPVVTYSDAFGTVVIADWVAIILRAMGGIDIDYLDYLTGYSYDDGRIAQEISSGTETFAYRGMAVGEFGALDSSQIKITLLPEYFD